MDPVTEKGWDLLISYGVGRNQDRLGHEGRFYPEELEPLLDIVIREEWFRGKVSHDVNLGGGTVHSEQPSKSDGGRGCKLLVETVTQNRGEIGGRVEFVGDFDVQNLL